jgi:predicted dehydrogenase
VGEEQAREWGVQFFTDWRDLISNSSVEAVIAATTPNLNLAIAGACAAAKKPLLIEKPLSINAREATDIVAVCKEADIPLTVGQTLRFNNTVVALKRELTRIGELHLFSASHRLEQTPHTWLDDPEIAGAGVTLHFAVHLFDVLRFITGREVRRVRASMFSRYNIRLEDLFIALVDMEGGAVGTVDSSKVGPARTGRYEFVGSSGQLQGDQVHSIVEFMRGTSAEKITQEKPVPTIISLLSAWSGFLRGEEQNPVPGEEGLAAVKICDACLRSAKEDRWIELDEK